MEYLRKCATRSSSFLRPRNQERNGAWSFLLSYRIVREHGGTITFEDVKGGGTEFVVVLPASK